MWPYCFGLLFRIKHCEFSFSCFIIVGTELSHKYNFIIFAKIRNKMRYNYIYILFAVFAALFISCGNGDGKDGKFTLRVQFDEEMGDTAFIKDVTSFIDTTYVVPVSGNDFVFSEKLDTTRVYDVFFSDNDLRFSVFAAKNTEVVASYKKGDDFVSISGGMADNKMLDDFNRDFYSSLRKSVSGNLLSLPDSVMKEYVGMMHSKAADFVVKNRSAYASAVIFRDYLWNSPMPDFALMDSVLKSMNGILMDMPQVYQASEVVKKKMLASPEKYVYSITMDCLDGKTLTIYQQREGYLFIDFWASWSKESMDFRKDLVEIYDKYKNVKSRKSKSEYNKVSFASVSLDVDSLLCKEANDDCGCEWYQVCDTKSWASEFVSKYAVTSLPDNILLAPNNKVIGRGLSVNELDSILNAELLGKD